MVAVGQVLAAPTGVEAPHRLEFHGYIRTGLGVSQGGATQADFQAPGAPARYRLGNEANTNLELALDYRYQPPDTATAGQSISALFMLDGFAPFGESGQLGVDHVAQAYLTFDGFLASGARAWVGRRYYDRKSIHLNNYYWLNPGQNSQAGGGVEGLRMGPAELKVALFRVEDAGVKPLDPALLGDGTLNSTIADLRYANLPLGVEGKLTFWGQGVQRAGQSALGFPVRNGVALGAWYDRAKVLGGVNTLAVAYRQGAAIPQGCFNPNPIREDQGYDLERATSWEVNNNLLIEPAPDFSMQWGTVVRSVDFGRPGAGGDTLRWYSTGVRPIYYLTDHLNLALEYGVDYVDDEVQDLTGTLHKVTTALQLAKARGYYALPVLRLFATWATWSDAFKGRVGLSPGDAPYGEDTSGWIIGTQVEAWW